MNLLEKMKLAEQTRQEVEEFVKPFCADIQRFVNWRMDSPDDFYNETFFEVRLLEEGWFMVTVDQYDDYESYIIDNSFIENPEKWIEDKTAEKEKRNKARLLIAEKAAKEALELKERREKYEYERLKAKFESNDNK